MKVAATHVGVGLTGWESNPHLAPMEYSRLNQGGVYHPNYREMRGREQPTSLKEAKQLTNKITYYGTHLLICVWWGGSYPNHAKFEIDIYYEP